VSFFVCVALCAVFCLSVVCLIVVPLPPVKSPLEVQLNNNSVHPAVLLKFTRVRLGEKKGELSRTGSHRDDTGKQLGRLGQKAPGLAAARDGEQ
jgi:hypothetical protein